MVDSLEYLTRPFSYFLLAFIHLNRNSLIIQMYRGSYEMRKRKEERPAGEVIGVFVFVFFNANVNIRKDKEGYQQVR